MLDTWEFRAILEKGKALNPLRLKASEMAPPVGLEPTTLSVRNIVALLAWSASQCSLFLPAQSTASSAAGSAVGGRGPGSQLTAGGAVCGMVDGLGQQVK